MLRLLFFVLMFRPLVFIFLGLNVRNRHLLPQNGPAILVANHNSHLDTLILMGLFPLRTLDVVRPVAAADYWLKNPRIGWFANHIMRIVPVARTGRAAGEHPLAGVSNAIQENQIVIYFPEGSRGDAEIRTNFRSGISRLAEWHPDVPIFPIFMYGAGKSLPKGEGILVPFICDVFVGEPMRWNDHPSCFLAKLEERMEALATTAHVAQWE